MKHREKICGKGFLLNDDPVITTQRCDKTKESFIELEWRGMARLFIYSI